MFVEVYSSMLVWIKKNWTLLLVGLFAFGLLLFGYACEPKVHSLVDATKKVNRQELQLELDQLIGLAQLRMMSLDKQEELRAIILQNALILVQGQPLNPVGIITALAAVYGATQGGRNVTKLVKNKRNKGKVNNGRT